MRRIYDLRRYGLPETLLDIWVQQQGEFLLPVQEAAVQRYGLFDGRSLVISSPTSSGKTFVGEMAAMRAAFAGKRVLYLTPLRALADEKFYTFRSRYGAYGIKVVVATRDRREFDRDIEQGDFHLAVLVYEKLAQLLVRQPHLLRTVALVVVDELQMLGDPDRGPGLELSLAKLLGSVPRPQILGLSAVLREAQEVAQWLRAELLFHEERPVELYQGVLQQGRFRYKAYNTGDTGEERLAVVESRDPRQILSTNVKHLVGRGEQVLVFLKSKRDTMQCALGLANALALPPAQEALQALEGLEETALKAQLRTAFAGGVAFHHADLTPEERGVVETHYRQGGLRVIACTTTLAFGVNLPASTVFLESTKWATDPRTGAALEVPLSWAEYENISGRAGRLGFHERGRSILIALNQFQADWLWRSYILGEYEQLRPAPGQKGLVDRVLNLIASKLCLTREEVHSFFALTYLGFQRGGKTEGLSAEIEKILAALVRGQLIRSDDEGRLEATTLGEVAARKGVQAATAVKLARFFADAGSRDIPELELLYLLNLTADGKRVYVPLSNTEHRGRSYERQVSQRLQACDQQEVGEELHDLLRAKMLPTAQEVRAAKLALLALGWIAGEEIADLEQHYQCYAGTIKTQMAHLSWLADAATEVASVMGWGPTQRLSDLAERLRLGVDAAGLAASAVPEAGQETIEALTTASMTTSAQE
ncbi:MAG TPA: DEAD/DEAH box helicase [Candidatus Binatia bacterium]|nr:DEAD/DEAH box helicase [Candidatus Binatia bacterium]